MKSKPEVIEEKEPARIGLLGAVVESMIQLFRNDKPMLDRKLKAWFGNESIETMLPAKTEHIPRVPFDPFTDLTVDQIMTILKLMELLRLKNALSEFEKLG